MTKDQLKVIRTRRKSGLNMVDFGEVLGVGHSSISLIESGKRNPSKIFMKLLEEKFKDDLYCEER